jgi:hypothetical protein
MFQEAKFQQSVWGVLPSNIYSVSFIKNFSKIPYKITTYFERLFIFQSRMSKSNTYLNHVATLPMRPREVRNSFI